MVCDVTQYTAFRKTTAFELEVILLLTRRWKHLVPPKVWYMSLTLHSATCHKTALWSCANSFGFSSYLTENRQSITNTSQLWKSYELHKCTLWKMQSASALKHQVHTVAIMSKISGCSGANTLPNCLQCEVLYPALRHIPAAHTFLYASTSQGSHMLGHRPV